MEDASHELLGETIELKGYGDFKCGWDDVLRLPSKHDLETWGWLRRSEANNAIIRAKWSCGPESTCTDVSRITGQALAVGFARGADTDEFDVTGVVSGIWVN